MRVWQLHAERGIECRAGRRRCLPRAPPTRPPRSCRVVLRRRSSRHARPSHRGAGRHPCADAVRDRRRCAVRSRPGRVPGSAWCRAWRSGSTARPTRAPAAPALRQSAVVAGGLDRPYPARHARLWQRVAERGAVVSESPAGCPNRALALSRPQPAPGRPERRRHRDREPSSWGSPPHRRCRGDPGHSGRRRARIHPERHLRGHQRVAGRWSFPRLFDCRHPGGPVPRRRPGLATARVPAPEAKAPIGLVPTPGEDRAVYEALSSDPASLDDLVRVTGLDLPALCGGLERLAQAGLAYDTVGGGSGPNLPRRGRVVPARR